MEPELLSVTRHEHPRALPMSQASHQGTLQRLLLTSHGSNDCSCDTNQSGDVVGTRDSVCGLGPTRSPISAARAQRCASCTVASPGVTPVSAEDTFLKEQCPPRQQGTVSQDVGSAHSSLRSGPLRLAWLAKSASPSPPHPVLRPGHSGQGRGAAPWPCWGTPTDHGTGTLETVVR